jgi:putative ABC transport system permease protein
VWRATVKGLLAHKLRLGLTGLAVVLGVAFVAGTYVLTDTIDQTFDDLFGDISGGVDVSVRAASGFTGGDVGRETIPAELVATVAAVPGVAAAEGGVGGYAQLVDESGEAITTTGAPTLGTNWMRTAALSPLRLRTGREPRQPDEVVVDAVTARRNDLALGDTVRILFRGPPGDFTIVGITGFGEADNLAGATLAAFETTTAQQVLAKPGRFDTIDVKAADGVGALELRQRVEAVLPAGFESVTGSQVAEEGAEDIQDALGFLGTALLVFAGIALFVGAFIILNTFSILVAQRTRELGLLRALGAQRGQVLRSVVAEAAIVGLVASLVGVGLGVLVAIALQALLRAFGIDLPGTATRILPRTVIVSLVVGEVVTLLSAIVPARRASSIAPMAALREGQPEDAGSLRRRTLAGVVLASAGVAVLAWALMGDAGGIGLVGLGAALVFVGVALVAPVAARPLARAIGSPLPRLMGISGKLARQNAMRNPRRTAATAAALTVGLGLVGCVSVLAASIKASSVEIIDRALAADFVVSTDQFMPSISTALADRLSLVAELGAVTALQTGDWRFEGEGRSLFAGDPSTIASLMNLEVRSGNLDGLAEGGLMVEEREAEEQGFAVGSTVAMEFARTGVQQVPVAGTYARNQLLGNYLVSTRTYMSNYTERLDFVVLARAAPGVPAATARAALERVTAEFPNVVVRDQTEFKETQKDQVNQALGLVSALLGLAIVIALLGIVNTLALSVFERTRELGLLRAVGMSRRQVRAMIRGESVIIAVIGAVLGLAVGVLFGSVLVADLRSQGISRLVIPVPQLLFHVAMAAVAGVLAAVFPARRAANLDVLAAIARE